MPFGMYSDEEDEQKGVISPVVRDYLMRKRQNGQPQPVDTLNDVSRHTPPMTGLSVDQENMTPLAKSPQDGLTEASDSSGVRDAEQADMIAQGAGSLSKILAQALNAKYAGHTKPMDYSSFDSISQMGKPGLAAAQRQRQEKIDSFKMSDELSQRDKKEALDSSDRSRRTSWEDESRGFERTAQGNSAEDRTRQLGLQSEEDDSNSGVSRSYQAMATKMTGGKSDYSGVSATRLKAALPALSKMYEFDQTAQNRKDELNLRHQMHNETIQNRLDAARQKKEEQDITVAAKKAEAAKPKPLGNEQQKRKDDATGAFTAIDGMGLALKDGDWTVKPIGTNNFLMNRERFVEFFGRLQSGGAIGKEEGEKFKHLMPIASDTREQQESKLAAMKSQLETVLKPLIREGDGSISALPPQPPQAVDHGDEVEQDGKVFKKDPSGKYVRIK